MTDAVKRDSRSNSGRGQARTRLARRAVIEAARTLFLERGYATTTIETISEHSDVPSATVYRLFSSKLGILKALLDTSIAGDDKPLAVPERPDVASMFAEPDPRKLLAGFAAFKHHLSYLPHSGSVLPALGDDVTQFEQTKGSLHFAIDEPLPKRLVKKLVTTRMRQLGLE